MVLEVEEKRTLAIAGFPLRPGLMNTTITSLSTKEANYDGIQH
jgi:hypothetical protein